MRERLPGTESATARSSPAAVLEVLEDLATHEFEAAPHVVAKLMDAVAGDLPTVREMTAQLSPAQRCGMRALPDPLPLVPPIAAELGELDLEPRDRDLLLAIAVCLDDDLEVLLRFDGRDAHEIAAGPVGAHLVVGAGRCRLRDPRLAVWLLSTTSSGELAEVHRRLADATTGTPRHPCSDWHRARASLQRDPGVARSLTATARELSEAGFVEEALRLAAEAAAHAEGEDRIEACLVAGSAAVGAGYAADAVDWLSGSFPVGDSVHRAESLGVLLVAETLMRGAVPDLNPSALRPTSADPALWYAWARAAALAAVLCAERGDRPAMRGWLDALREATARVGADDTLRDPVVALCWLLVGEEELFEHVGCGPLTGGMLAALRAALAGDIETGLMVLSAQDSAPARRADPFVAGFEHSPLVDAYRAVTEVLLLFWSGKVSVARERLLAAAVTLPVAMPFAGLGVVLARRLDLAVLGRLSILSLSLTAALPAGIRIDQFVDEGIQSYLAGSTADAAALLRLWDDQGAPQTPLAVPGLDEIPTARTGATPNRIEPPELRAARRLRQRIHSATDGRWATEYPEIVEQSRGLRSPFTRGRIEAMLGIACVIRDDQAAGFSHLRAAQSLFDAAGADAWSAAMELRLGRLAARTDAAASASLTACRLAWEPLLTSRELDVAMLVAAGTSNREIAEQLNVSVRTVEVHVSRLFTKLDVRSRVELTVLAHRTDQYL